MRPVPKFSTPDEGGRELRSPHKAFVFLTARHRKKDPDSVNSQRGAERESQHSQETEDQNQHPRPRLAFHQCPGRQQFDGSEDTAPDAGEKQARLRDSVKRKPGRETANVPGDPRQNPRHDNSPDRQNPDGFEQPKNTVDGPKSCHRLQVLMDASCVRRIRCSRVDHCLAAGAAELGRGLELFAASLTKHCSSFQGIFTLLENTDGHSKGFHSES
jgi:hypothetical protein